MVVLFLIFWETSVLSFSNLWWEVRGCEYREIWSRWPRTVEGSYIPCVSLTDIEGQWSSGGMLQLTCMGGESENRDAWRRVERLPIPNLRCDSYLYIFEILQCEGGVSFGKTDITSGWNKLLHGQWAFPFWIKDKMAAFWGYCVCGQGKGCLNRVSSSSSSLWIS